MSGICILRKYFGHAKCTQIPFFLSKYVLMPTYLIRRFVEIFTRTNFRALAYLFSLTKVGFKS